MWTIIPCEPLLCTKELITVTFFNIALGLGGYGVTEEPPAPTQLFIFHTGSGAGFGVLS